MDATVHLPCAATPGVASRTGCQFNSPVCHVPRLITGSFPRLRDSDVPIVGFEQPGARRLLAICEGLSGLRGQHALPEVTFLNGVRSATTLGVTQLPLEIGQYLRRRRLEQ